MSYAIYTFRRLLWAVPVLLLATFFIFSTIYIGSGGPAETLAGQAGSQEVIEEVREEMGLDRPIPVIYLDWLGGMVQGDMGTSYVAQSGTPVADIVIPRIFVTVELATFALLFALVFALPLGTLAALNRNTWVDHLTRFGSIFGVAVPYFWIGLVLILVLGVNLNLTWVVSGYVPFEEGIYEHVRSMIVPAFALSLPYMGLLTRMTRSSMLDAINADYVRTGRAMGLSNRTVVFRDALHNAFLPILTVIGMSFGLLIRGTVLIEIVFSISGLGRLLVNGAFQGDYAIIQAIMFIIVIVFVTTNLVTDLLYGLVDPRITVGEEE